MQGCREGDRRAPGRDTGRDAAREAGKEGDRQVGLQGGRHMWPKGNKHGAWSELHGEARGVAWRSGVLYREQTQT